MTNIIVSAEFLSQPSLRFPPSNLQRVNPNAFLARMERLNARRNDSRADAAQSVQQHPDAGLLKERDALNTAWSYEVNALIVMKRLKTAEAEAAAKAARAATALIAGRIEATKALTLGGLKAKARASLWRRHGEPSAVGNLVEETCLDAPFAAATSCGL